MGPNHIEFDLAKEVIPGGVNSPVRAFKSVGGEPIFIKKAKGPYLYDLSGTRLIDYILSYGPLVLGHRRKEVIKTIAKTAKKGTSYGAPTLGETRLAYHLVQDHPFCEQFRLVNSGTEAVMSALRLARGFTGKNKVIKFTGCYHGHHDSLLVAAGSGGATLGQADSDGVPKSFVEHTLVVQYNNLKQVQDCVRENKADLAAIIVEPVAGNMGVVLPDDGFLKNLRSLCDDSGALLIFDEVMTGYRASDKGAWKAFGVKPDILCLGKVIGGGLPVGAYGARKEIMEKIAPLGGVYQAGTLSGNPLAVQAGITTLELIKQGEWNKAHTAAKSLVTGIQKIIDKHQYPIHLQSIGTMLSLHFCKEKARSFEDLANCDKEKFNIFFSEMLAAGIHIAPSPFEAWFTSSEHSPAIIQKSLDIIEHSLKKAFK